jgi:hypothetical protein
VRAAELEEHLKVARREEFRAEDLTARPWDVVHKAIPRDADAGLLWEARERALDCLRRLDKGDVELTEERFHERYAAAQARADDLDVWLGIFDELAPLEQNLANMDERHPLYEQFVS